MKRFLRFLRTLRNVIITMVALVAVLRTLSNDSADALTGLAHSYKKLKADQDVRELINDAGMAVNLLWDYVAAIGWHEWVVFGVVAIAATALWTVIYTVPRTAQKRRFRQRLRSKVPSVRRRNRKAGGNDR